VPQGNWRWRFQWSDLRPESVQKLHEYTERYGR